MWVGGRRTHNSCLAIRHDFGLEELRRRLSNQRCCPTATTKAFRAGIDKATRL